LPASPPANERHNTSLLHATTTILPCDSTKKAKKKQSTVRVRVRVRVARRFIWMETWGSDLPFEPNRCTKPWSVSSSRSEGCINGRRVDHEASTGWRQCCHSIILSSVDRAARSSHTLDVTHLCNASNGQMIDAVTQTSECCLEPRPSLSQSHTQLNRKDDV
jgi:hypothetical protein